VDSTREHRADGRIHENETTALTFLDCTWLLPGLQNNFFIIFGDTVDMAPKKHAICLAKDVAISLEAGCPKLNTGSLVRPVIGDFRSFGLVDGDHFRQQELCKEVADLFRCGVTSRKGV
jgi:hypothetical protein